MKHLMLLSLHTCIFFHSALFISITELVRYPLLPTQPSVCVCVCVCVPLSLSLSLSLSPSPPPSLFLSPAHLSLSLSLTLYLSQNKDLFVWCSDSRVALSGVPGLRLLHVPLLHYCVHGNTFSWYPLFSQSFAMGATEYLAV